MSGDIVQMVDEIPLAAVPGHYAGMRQSPYLMEYLMQVLRLCPRGGTALEVGVESGYGSVWLSQRGIRAVGISDSERVVERARAVNNILKGHAKFFVGSPSDLYDKNAPRFDVIHSQGLFEHYTAPEVRATLAQQVVCADTVVFSVPSVYYPFTPEFGDERLLPIELWEWMLSPFDIAELTYYGDPRLGGREHIRCILRGRAIDEQLAALMNPGDEPFRDGVSVIVHTRNEETRIAECLETVSGWADEIIVCDMESTDATVEIAKRFTGIVVAHPLIENFDRARNVSSMRAERRWIFFLDADERVPPGLGPAIRHIISTQPDSFEAMLVPFRHHFAGHWLKFLYPGYTAPRLLRNGKFLFNPRLHSGAQVDGRVTAFPPDNPDLALVHYSYDSLSHYLDKLNRYTDGESLNMHRDGEPFHWQRAVGHFVRDFQDYYERSKAIQDGPHGWIWSFNSAFYRYYQHAKLYERRFREGQIQPFETAVPESMEQMLQYMLAVCRQKPRAATPQIRVTDVEDAGNVVWSGPVFDPSGYGEESRHMLLALDQELASAESGGRGASEMRIAVQPIRWSDNDSDVSPEDFDRIGILAERTVKPGFVQILHNFPTLWERHPQARTYIGRTTFETDRLPQEWVRACNKMDWVWVPSEFNRRTFVDAGVEASKLVVVPECLDTEPYGDLGRKLETPKLVRDLKKRASFTFLSVFDWTLHKGWDVLIQAFLEEFAGDPMVQLVLKVWSSNGYAEEQIREQAEIVRRRFEDCTADISRVRLMMERLSQDGLIALYRAADAYVMPSRGEGWGRPYMEAMACGLPTIGTNWSGNTAFMDADNSYLLDYSLVPIPEAGWKEVPGYRGHRWAEPSVTHLRQVMRRVYERPDERIAVGARARQHILSNFSRETVGKQMREALDATMRPTAGARVQALSISTPSTLDGDCHKDNQKSLPDDFLSDDALGDVLRVRWEGAQFRWHSLGHVNREFVRNLMSNGVEASLVPTEPNEFNPKDEPRWSKLADRQFAGLSGRAHVHVRHQFPPRFEKPDEGRFVLIQPWEYGYLPKEWIAPIQAEVDEVWCHSRYVMDVYRNSGIDEAKLHLVPLGVDTSVFRTEAPPWVFTNEAGAERMAGPPTKPKPFTFLYVGGTVHRKGIDILLDAYLRAFSSADDVCLVVKDMGTSTVYPDNAGPKIRDLIADKSRPGIVYLDDNLTEHQLAGIYTACDCIVQPYRGEGFCLPVLEAMACGLPAAVPEGGPTDDFVDETVGYLLRADRKPMADSKIGPWECVEQPWAFEVDVNELVQKLREIRRNPDDARIRGAAAVDRVRKSWTWDHASAVALDRLTALKAADEGGDPREMVELPSSLKWSAGKSFATASVSADPQPAQPFSKRNRRRKHEKSTSEAEPPPYEDSSSHGTARETSHPRISLCMIVKNEERVLGDCLASIKPWVDEIIVVDTGSTDGTVAIAEAHEAKVFIFPWTDSFSEARNISLSHATCDWILWMDADDTIPEQCGQRLHDLVLMAPDVTTGIMMQVHIPPAPGEHGFTVVDHVKLFRNGLGLQFEGRIHEQILESIYRTGGTVERSDLYVVHSGYDHSPDGQRSKRARDLLLLEKDLTDRPDHPFVLFNIGMTAFHMKDFDKAIPALEKSLALSAPYESTVRKIYAMLAGCALELRDYMSAKRWIEQGLALYPKDPELLFRAGVIYREIGDCERAEESYIQLLLEREVGHIDSVDVTIMGYKGRHNLAILYADMQRWGEAEAQFKFALDLAPDFEPSLLGLRDLYRRFDRQVEAEAIAARLSTIRTKSSSPAVPESLIMEAIYK